MDNSLVQYELEFPNELTDEIVEQVGKIMDIPVDLSKDNKMEHIQDFESEEEILRIIRDPQDKKSFILVKFNKKDWYYAIVIRCRENVHLKVKEALTELNEEILEDYGDSLYSKIENVITNKNTLLEEYSQKYNIGLE